MTIGIDVSPYHLGWHEGLGHGPGVDPGDIREACNPGAERKYLAGVTATSSLRSARPLGRAPAQQKDVIVKTPRQRSERYERERRDASERHKRKLDQATKRDEQELLEKHASDVSPESE